MFDPSNNIGTIDVIMKASVLEKKSFLIKMLELSFSSKLDCDSYIVSIGKTTSKKIGALICSMRFEVAPYLCKSITWPCPEYCCNIWADAPNWYLEILDKLQKKYAGLLVLHLLPVLNL